MLRCSRLTEKDLKLMERSTDTDKSQTYNDGFYDGIICAKAMFVIQPRDKQTGWEIIASLPLEEQRKLPIIHGIGAFTLIGKQEIYFKSLYEWDGTNWVEVKE